MTNKQKFLVRNLLTVPLVCLLLVWIESVLNTNQNTSTATGFILTLLGIAYVALTGVWTFNEEWTTGKEFYEGKVRNNLFYDTYYLRLPKIKSRPRLVTLVTLLALIYLLFPLYNKSVTVYNTSKIYQNSYNQKTNQRLGFYDKLWKTYLQKEKITNLNKETFLEVTKLIMENRKDGANVSWKFISENQNIPYQEFTHFYKDLSIFIETQREDYYKLEVACQEVATANNLLLDTFPNNIINKVLRVPNIKFNYGLLSDSTNKVFKEKKENP